MATQDQTPTPTGLLDVEEDRAVVVLEALSAGEVADAGAFRKVAGALVTVVALVVTTYAVPALAFARPWTPADPVPFWNLVGREFLGEGEVAEEEASEVAQAQELARAAKAREDDAPVIDRKPVRKAGAKLPPYVPHDDDTAEVAQEIEDPSGKALDSFYGALARTDAGFEGAITRVSHFGDSAIGNDGITSSVRRRFQRRFGDAGHGFHLMAPPNASYKHQNVRFSHNGKWEHCFIIKRCRKDGHYGFGGTVFRSYQGAKSTFETARGKSAVGQKLSHFELWYAGRSGGGKIEVVAGRDEPVVIDTAADALEDRWFELDVEDGAHKFTVKAAGGGRVILYGVVMERGGPGVVWDGLSLIGAFTNRMSAFDPAHFRAQLQRRRSDLVVFMFGGNDMVRDITMAEYKAEYGKVLDLVRSGPKKVACLVMSPLDHGVRKGGRIVTAPGVKKMVAAQREIAFEKGCAFWNTYEAMGGEGSIGRWFKSEPKLASGDLAHLSPFGHRAMGELLYLALTRGYADYRKRTD